MALPDDIIAKIRSDFPEGEALPVTELLAGLQTEDARLFSDRILRCIVHVADGKFDELAEAVKLARLDWRDLIVNAEYDRSWKVRERDLSLPFSALL